MNMTYYSELLIKVETLQNMLLSQATGGQIVDDEYKQLRIELTNNPLIAKILPRFLQTCRDVSQFWQFIKRAFVTYQERRDYLWGEFTPVIDLLEAKLRTDVPSDATTTQTLKRIDSDAVHEAWRTALDRRFDDPDGAITSARSLIETICKHILDDLGIKYEKDCTLPQLHRLASDALGLSPSQQTHELLRRISGAVTVTVEGLGNLRNILGDAHGKGANNEKPEMRHAEFAVNLAGTLATFLVASWESRKTLETD